MVPKLIDFGVAKIASSEHTTLTGSLLGTPMYMSPEQASGEGPADHRTDIWAVGAVMYELLSDHCPFEGPSAAVVLSKILTAPLTPLSKRVKGLPAELEAVVHRALERDPAQRFASMDEFLHALLGYAAKPDPTISARHAASIPPPAASTPPAEEATAAGVHLPPHADPAVVRLALAGRGGARPQRSPGGSRGGGRLPADPHHRRVGAAHGAARARLVRGTPGPARPAGSRSGTPPPPGEALRDNALDEAVDHAEHAVVTCHASGEVLGRMRLVQAIALRWLGHYADSERCAQEATETLPARSPGWYAALGHLAMLGGYLGKNDGFPAILAELADAEAEGPVPAPHVIAACRLSVSLVRAGLVDRASRALASARAAAEPGTEDEPMVRAWIFVAAAEFAIHAGDPAGYLQHLEAAVTCFSEAGDVRNACLQRSNIGNGYMQLGAYARAKGLLREAIAVGEPMRLGFIAPVRANLGFVLARLGDLEQALEIETDALEQCIRERYRRFELASRIYLAGILWLREEARPAPGPAGLPAPGARLPTPPRRRRAPRRHRRLRQRPAHPRLRARQPRRPALHPRPPGRGTRRRRGGDGHPARARRRRGGRVAHPLATRPRRWRQPAMRRAQPLPSGEARRRLLERADRINDPRLRRSFLDHIPENARTLALAARYKPAR